MKVRSLAPYARSGLERRLAMLRRACEAVDKKTPDGLTAEEAEACLANWKPYFGDVKIEQEGEVWVVAVYHYLCPACRAEFDERDLRGTIDAEGVSCPKCGHRHKDWPMAAAAAKAIKEFKS